MLKQLTHRCLVAAASGSTAGYVWPAAWLRTEEPAAAASLSIDLRELMIRVGRLVFDTCRAHYPHARHWLIVLGTGNNAGDGLEVAQHCRAHGIAVTVWAMTPRPGSAYPPECAAAMAAWKEMSGYCHMLPDHPDAFEAMWQQQRQQYQGQQQQNEQQLNQLLPEGIDLIVDALLGTGARGAPRGSYVPLIKRLNELPMPRVAIDIPSGLDAETGVVPPGGVAVLAQLTVTFLAIKPGLLLGHGKSYTGQLCYDSVGLTDYLHHPCRLQHATMRRLWARDLVHYFGTPRPRTAHKGSQGSVLLVGGGESEHAGAVMMAAEAVVCTGAGLTRVLTAATHRSALLARCPEAMVFCVPPTPTGAARTHAHGKGGDVHTESNRDDAIDEDVWAAQERYSNEAATSDYIYRWLHGYVAAAAAAATTTKKSAHPSASPAATDSGSVYASDTSSGLVLAVGPGLGTRGFGRSAFAALHRLLSEYPQTRVVLDADALNLLAAAAADAHAHADPPTLGQNLPQQQQQQEEDDEEKQQTVNPSTTRCGDAAAPYRSCCKGEQTRSQLVTNKPSWWPVLPNSIITPHPGEAARLLRCSVAEVESDRVGAARRLAAILGGTCILKGAGTLVYRHNALHERGFGSHTANTSAHAEQHEVKVNNTGRECPPASVSSASASPSSLSVSAEEDTSHWTHCAYIDAGNAGMATGGMGDVLTGVTAAVAAQMRHLDMFEVACAAALVHSVAADVVAEASPGRGTRGVRPTELFAGIQQCINASDDSFTS